MRLLVFIFSAFVQVINAQTDSLAVVHGTVKDLTDDPLIGATVKISQDGKVVRGTITDFDGKYLLQVKPGTYDLEVSYTGFNTIKLEGISLTLDESRLQHFEMEYARNVEIIYYYEFIPPLIDFSPGNTGATFRASELRNRY